MAASKITSLLSALALAAVVLPVGTYAAQADSDTSVVTVSMAGLNAARPADQAILRHRITVATHKLCDAVTQGDALTAPGYADCVGKANADARSQLEDRIATARHGTTVASIALK
jgi:UrcA family protein